MAEEVLRVEGLVAGYTPEVDILRGVDIVVNRGEIVTIVGPNGAGKSTLMKSVFGLVPPREGSVKLYGEDITGLAPHSVTRKGVTYVPQLDNVFPSLTVEENLTLGALGVEDNIVRERLKQMYAFFPRLEERRMQAAGTMSGGERQMVAMARALMMEPSVLLLDEPSAGLSPMMQDEVFYQTKRINAAGVTVIMVEQNARRCLQICHRGYVLDQGRNAYTATGDQLMHDPKVIELYLGTLARAQ